MLKVIITVVAMLVTSYLIGGLFIKEKQGIAAFLLGGFFTQLALFEIITLPCIALHVSAAFYGNIMMGVIAALSVLSLIRNKTDIYRPISKLVDGIISLGRDRLLLCLMVCAVGLIAMQTAAAVMGAHYDDDDSFYVATATTAVDTDSIYAYNPYTGAGYHHLPARYVLSPWPMLGVAWSHLTTIRPAVFFHTALPAVLIPLSYIAMYLLACRIWEEDSKKRKVWGFLVALCFLQMFAAFSTWSMGARLLYRVWQGKTVLASVILPTIFTLMFYEWDEARLSRRVGFYLFITMTSACFVSSMGIILPLAELFALAVTKVIQKKAYAYALWLIPCAVSNLAIGVVYALMR